VGGTVEHRLVSDGRTDGQTDRQTDTTMAHTGLTDSVAL